MTCHKGEPLRGFDTRSATAVIDNDFVTVGDAAFDLVTLALTSLVTPSEPGVVTRLSQAEPARPWKTG